VYAVVVDDLPFSGAVQRVEATVAGGLICEQPDYMTEFVILVRVINLGAEEIIRSSHLLPGGTMKRLLN
jgi:hypothetical protein